MTLLTIPTQDGVEFHFKRNDIEEIIEVKDVISQECCMTAEIRRIIELVFPMAIKGLFNDAFTELVKLDIVGKYSEYLDKVIFEYLNNEDPFALKYYRFSSADEAVSQNDIFRCLIIMLSNSKNYDKLIRIAELTGKGAFKQRLFGYFTLMNHRN